MYRFVKIQIFIRTAIKINRQLMHILLSLFHVVSCAKHVKFSNLFE